MTTNADLLSQNSDLRPLISIIVPVYNCEKYISCALDSLVSQDCPEKNYEIVITDDGSTDSTGKICDDYASKYSFIHVTHTKNMGVSHARNTAMFQCKGEYITFCDGDDEVSPQLISVLTGAVELYGRPDIIAYSHFKIMPSEGWPVYDIKSMKLSEAEFIDSETLIMRAASSWGGYTWNKIFRSELAKSLRFDETLKVSMDHYWLMSLLTLHRDIKICCTDYYLYYYIDHPNVGQTRQLDRVYDESGMKRTIPVYEKTLTLKNFPERAAEKIHGRIYEQSIFVLYENQVNFSQDTYRRLRSYMRRYALEYYRSYETSRFFKIAAFIKHILIIFHIHKRRKKNPRH